MKEFTCFFNRESNNSMDISKFENFVSQHTPYEVSATAQQILEDTLLEWISQNILFDTKNILLSGGILRM